MPKKKARPSEWFNRQADTPTGVYFGTVEPPTSEDLSRIPGLERVDRPYTLARLNGVELTDMGMPIDEVEACLSDAGEYRRLLDTMLGTISPTQRHVDPDYLLMTTMEGSIHLAEEPMEAKCRNCGRNLILNQSAEIHERAIAHTSRSGTIECYCAICYSELFANCNRCYGDFLIDQMKTVGGSRYCKKCYDHMFAVCPRCEGVFEKRRLKQSPTGDLYCSSCYGLLYKCCNICGNERRIGELLKDHDMYWCQSCYDNHRYVTCAVCGKKKHRGDIGVNAALSRGGYMCKVCRREEEKVHDSHDYSYKPEPRFDPPVEEGCYNNLLYEGTEVEADGSPGSPGRTVEAYRKILDIMGRDFVYIKPDSSVPNGPEIVSHPATLERHMSNEWHWQELFTWLINNGYHAHDVNNCGLHIHVNKTYFGTDWQQEEMQLKLLLFHEKFWDPVITFSRRTLSLDGNGRHYRRYNYIPKLGEERTLLEQAQANPDRHYAVNIRPRDTVELRVFRGTLIYDQFIAALQFVRVLVDYLKPMNPEEVNKSTWQDFMAYATGKYEVLDKYFTERGLLEKKKEPEDDSMTYAYTYFSGTTAGYSWRA